MSLNMQTELLIPAGNLDKLRLALAYGADAVYAGAGEFSLRPQHASLSADDFIAAGKICAGANKKIYAALNIMAFNHELSAIKNWLQECPRFNLHGLIIGDAGVVKLAREIVPDIPIHISTQMGVANLASAQFWESVGAKRIVLARECTLSDAQAIVAATNCEIEIFIHGAMCAAVAGRCLLSAHLSRKSGNRGDCKHSCRWEYQLVENTRPQQSMEIFETKRDTIILASRDLCLLEHLPAVIRSGIHSLKIEGRMKSEYYVAAVTRVYRRALDEYFSSPTNYSMNNELLAELHSVTHRPYCSGFAFGYEPTKLQAEDNNYYADYEYVGRVLDNDFCAVKNPFNVGETLEFIAPNMHGGKITISEIRDEKGVIITQAKPTTNVQIKYDIQDNRKSATEKLSCEMLLRRRVK